MPAVAVLKRLVKVVELLLKSGLVVLNVLSILLVDGFSVLQVGLDLGTSLRTNLRMVDGPHGVSLPVVERNFFSSLIISVPIDPFLLVFVVCFDPLDGVVVEDLRDLDLWGVVNGSTQILQFQAHASPVLRLAKHIFGKLESAEAAAQHRVRRSTHARNAPLLQHFTPIDTTLWLRWHRRHLGRRTRSHIMVASEQGLSTERNSATGSMRRHRLTSRRRRWWWRLHETSGTTRHAKTGRFKVGTHLGSTQIERARVEGSLVERDVLIGGATLSKVREHLK